MLEIFKARRSIRKYLTKEVPNPLITRVLEAARWAPSAHNSQPWRFIILKKKEARAKLAKVLASAWLRDLLASGIKEEEARELVKKRSIERYTNSPVVILACLDKNALRDDSKEEYIMGVQGLSAALQNLLLAASMEGLGACWTCGPLYCPEEVRRAFGLPEGWEPQAAITLGYPRHVPNPKKRKSIEEVAFDEGLRPW